MRSSATVVLLKSLKQNVMETSHRRSQFYIVFIFVYLIWSLVIKKAKKAKNDELDGICFIKCRPGIDR